MQELRSCFAPPNYHSNKHVSFAQGPIVCSSVPFLLNDDDYSDDLSNEEEENCHTLKTFDDDEDEIQSKSLFHRHYSFFFALFLGVFTFIILINIHNSPSRTFGTDISGFMNSLGHKYFFKAIIDLII